MEALGDRIKAIRGNISQTVFSEKLGITQNTLSRYERNQRLPDAQLIAELCNSFNISADWILTGRGAMHTGGSTGDSEKSPEPASQIACPRCAQLEKELEAERSERRELAAENRILYKEKEELLRENGELKAAVARLEERKNAMSVEASIFAQSGSGVA